MTTVTRSSRVVSDHFEPEATRDPLEARKLKVYLEQIDYAAFAANREVVGQTIGRTDLSKFKHLAIATAQARARWVAAAIAATSGGAALTPDQSNQLAVLRRAFEELSEAYEAMRRMVERGYLVYYPGA
ncbi:hypothetical protein [Terricaulis sp.]|uniref:hypothetical protein n=1 Tax=Terricaulis sp. TaxID=2768686 RepID=UPI00378323B0